MPRIVIKKIELLEEFEDSGLEEILANYKKVAENNDEPNPLYWNEQGGYGNAS